MFKFSKLEKTVLILTAVFVLGTFSWFQVQNQDKEVTRIALSHSPQEAAQIEETSPAPGILEGETINLNTAPVSDLTRLPGIGEKRAESILAYREENGPFSSVQELTEVPGIGAGILAQITDYVTVGDCEEGG